MRISFFYYLFGLVWFDGLSTTVHYLMPNPFLYTYQQFYFKQFSLTYVDSFFVYTLLNVKTVQEIQFSISTLFSSIWPIDRTLSGATTLGQSGPGSDGNEEVLCISQCSSITGSSPSDCQLSYPGHLFEGSYPSAEMQFVYSAAPDDWAVFTM